MKQCLLIQVFETIYFKINHANLGYRIILINQRLTEPDYQSLNRWGKNFWFK
ncbi:hypothetical protein L1283_005722 [Sphingobacterium sp. HSC-15S19]|jgi:hypothetical protein